jgi:hypothetical protein
MRCNLWTLNPFGEKDSTTDGKSDHLAFIKWLTTGQMRYLLIRHNRKVGVSRALNCTPKR